MFVIAPTEPIEVPLYGVAELKVPRETEFLSFQAPDGQLRKIPAFWKDAQTRCVRFSPDEPGTWNYCLAGAEGSVICIEQPDLSVAQPLSVDSDGWSFVRKDGSPCFLMGYECNWLWAMNMRPNGQKRLEKFLDKIASYGFNFVRVNVFAYDTEWCAGNVSDEDYGPPPLYCFGGTNENPDFSQLNPIYFEHFDRMMEALQARGIYVELYFKVFNKQVNWPQRASREEQNFFDEVVARYQAFSNVIWDFSKEAYYEIHKDYVANFYKRISKRDAYHRLKTLHDDKVFYGDERLRENVDFLSSQQHFDIYTTALRYRDYHMPVTAAEFGYECGAKGTKDLSYMYGQTPEEFVRRAWEVVMAKAYPTYYYTYSAWDIISPDHTPKGYEYWKYLRDYLERIDWQVYTPRPEYCLWRGRALEKDQTEYLYLIEENEHALFYMPGSKSGLEIEWFNMYTNETLVERLDINEVERRGEAELIVLTNPFQDQWAVAHVKKRG